jgi:hypothetical protein
MNAIGTAVGGWALDATAVGISAIMWWTALLTLIPGVLWVLWIATGHSSDRAEMETGG